MFPGIRFGAGHRSRKKLTCSEASDQTELPGVTWYLASWHRQTSLSELVGGTQDKVKVKHGVQCHSNEL